MEQPIAIVMSEVFLRRLTPALMPFARQQRDFRILSIHRPVDELTNLVRALNPAGLITEWLPDVTEALLELGIATVIADTDLLYPGAASIDVDDWEVGAEAARAFAQAGYQNFACLGNDTPYSNQRIEGFQRELGASVNVAVHQEAAFNTGSYSEDFADPGASMRTWLTSLPKPVGVFAVHDPLGRFLCGVCRQMRLQVPERVAVIGANNDELVCGLSYPMLSSVAIPWDTIGALVGEMALRLVSGHPAPAEPLRVRPGGVVLRHSANHLAVEDPALRRAMSFLSARFQEPITVGSLCSELKLARRSVERKFQEVYQCTPWEMLCRLRVNRAKQLLADTKHPISVVSELCGFNDPERMSVVFKRISGVPPSRFRKEIARLSSD